MDYFFQHHLASFFIGQGISFYAIELSKYGSSIKKPPTRKLFPITLANTMKKFLFYLIKLKKMVILNGRSTGGLITTHYVLQGESLTVILSLLIVIK